MSSIVAAQGVRRAAMQAVDQPPQHVTHLAESGRGAEDDGGVVAVQVPQHRHGRGEVLAQAVARFDRHASLAHHRVQHVLLLGPQGHAQDVRGEPRRMDPVLVAGGAELRQVPFRRRRIFSVLMFIRGLSAVRPRLGQR